MNETISYLKKVYTFVIYNTKKYQSFMIKKFFPLICFFLLNYLNVFSQGIDQIIDKAYFENLDNKIINAKSLGEQFEAFVPLNRKFELTVILIDDEMDTSFITTTVQEHVDNMNTFFLPMGVEFYITKVFVDPDTTAFNGFSTTDSPESAKGKLKQELINRYYEPNTINIYYIPDIPASAVGFSPCPGPEVTDPNSGIFIDKRDADNMTLVHEMGHYFGLLHPFDGWDEGTGDYVNGSECETRGDKICDTPAEPDMTDLITPNCLYTGDLRDSNGDFYIPSVTNIMSYGNTGCACGFTTGQYMRMRETYLTRLSHLR